MNTFDFSESALSALRDTVREGLSEYRFAHIAAVERMIVRLGALFLEDEIPMLRAAALLHDFTKELSETEHERIFASHGILLSDEDRLFPKLYHGVTASLLIPEVFPQFASDDLLRAVRYHTAGRAEITLPEMLLYLADYIAESRKYNDCVRLRAYFWLAKPETMTMGERTAHLYRTLIRSVNSTVYHLTENGEAISPDSIRMRNDLITRLRAIRSAD